MGLAKCEVFQLFIYLNVVKCLVWLGMNLYALDIVKLFQGQVYVDLKLNHYQSLGLNVEDGHKLTVR